MTWLTHGVLTVTGSVVTPQAEKTLETALHERHSIIELILGLLQASALLRQRLIAMEL